MLALCSKVNKCNFINYSFRLQFPFKEMFNDYYFFLYYHPIFSLLETLISNYEICNTHPGT